MTKKQTIYNLLYPLISVAAAIALWGIFSLAYNKPIVAPQIDVVFAELIKLLSTPSTYMAVGQTMARTIVCYVIATAISLLLAVCSAKQLVGRIIAPFMTIISSVPTVALILLIVIFYNSNLSPIVIAFLVSMPIIYGAMVSALKSANELEQMCDVYNVSLCKKVRWLYLPTLLPVMANHSSTTLVLTLKLVVSAEVLAYTAVGIGDGMYVARVNVDTAQLLAWTVICVALCFALQLAVAGIKQACRRQNG